MATGYVREMSAPQSWLMLMYSLPTRQSAERVSLWRKLKKFGALPFKTSAYVLPNEALHRERFQWLAKQVLDGGGDATLVLVTEIEGLSSDQMVGLFNDAREFEYNELTQELNKLAQRNKDKKRESFEAEVEKLNRHFHEIREIDFFHCPAAHDAEMLLKRTEGMFRPKTRTVTKLKAEDFTGKAWLTRPRPEVDRAGSAWLIRKYIDSKARFVFGERPTVFPGAIPYDMFDVEFTHQGEDCTFETLIARFDIQDPAVRQIAEMIHDADIEDGKFERVEGIGIDRLLKGWAKQGLGDLQILAKGFECFDALYEALRK